MRLLLVLAAVGVFATAAGFGAGVESIIKQKAKDIRDKNNAAQGVPTAPPKAGPAPQAAQPQTSTYAAPAVPAAVVQAQKRLETDFAGIKAGATVSEELKKSISGSLLALCQTPKPAEASLAPLANSLSAGFAEKPLSNSRRTRLINTITQLLNPRKCSQAQLDEYLADVRFIFQAEGLEKAKATAIADAARAVVSEMQTGGSP